MKARITVKDIKTSLLIHWGRPLIRRRKDFLPPVLRPHFLANREKVLQNHISSENVETQRVTFTLIQRKMNMSRQLETAKKTVCSSVSGVWRMGKKEGRCFIESHTTCVHEDTVERQQSLFFCLFFFKGSLVARPETTTTTTAGGTLIPRVFKIFIFPGTGTRRGRGVGKVFSFALTPHRWFYRDCRGNGASPLFGWLKTYFIVLFYFTLITYRNNLH